MLPQRSDRAIWFVIFTLFSLMVASFVFSQYQIYVIKLALNRETPQPQIIYSTTSPVGRPSMTPSMTPTPAPVATSNTSVQSVLYVTPKPSTQITYIPLSGGNTQSTGWADIPSTSFTLSIGDYGSRAMVYWDANLRVDNANGTTYARIFDKTHGIAVNGSEISVSNQSQSTNVVSGVLSFWQGNNNYLVQIKSLNSSTAFIDSGRIKIIY